MAQTLPHVFYANYGNGSSTGYFAIAVWQAGHTYSTVGTLIRQSTTPTQGNERVFICAVAGASGGSEPLWTVTSRAKNTDNGVTWYECTGNPALNGDTSSTPASSTERSQAVTAGIIIKKNTADFYFICTTAGTCGAGEPTYNTSTGSTTSDNTAVWTCIGAVATFATAWGAPLCRLSSAALIGESVDTLYVSASHNEATTGVGATGFSFGSGSTCANVICVSNTPSAFPPVAADITTGATISDSGSAILSLTGCMYVTGVIFNQGSSSALSVAGSASNSVHLANCQLNLNGTGGQTFAIGVANGRSKVILDNTPIQFNGNSSAGLAFGGHVLWRNTASAITKTGASWPTILIQSATPGGADVLIENNDLSGFGGTNFLGSGSTAGRIVCKDSKLPSLTIQNATVSGPYGTEMDFINCDTGGSIYNHSRYWPEGVLTASTTAVCTSGASDGTTAYSWQIATTSITQWQFFFECLPISIWNTTITPTNVTVTIEAAYVGTALPNNDDIWLDTNYYGTSSSVLGTENTTTKATILSSNTPWSSSSALWGGSAAARQNTHAYVVGDMIGVSSGGSIVRLFYCTTPGTSSGSLPGGYASATDGSQITDGTAVFTAVERFQLVTTLSTPKIQSAGTITCYVRAAKASAVFFVDPLITLS